MHPSSIAARLNPALIGLALLVFGSIVLWVSYLWISRRLELAPKKPKLSVIMAALFVCLSIPILIFILTYN